MDKYIEIVFEFENFFRLVYCMDNDYSRFDQKFGIQILHIGNIEDDFAFINFNILSKSAVKEILLVRQQAKNFPAIAQVNVFQISFTSQYD